MCEWVDSAITVVKGRASESLVMNQRLRGTKKEKSSRKKSLRGQHREMPGDRVDHGDSLFTPEAPHHISEP